MCSQLQLNQCRSRLSCMNRETGFPLQPSDLDVASVLGRCFRAPNMRVKDSHRTVQAGRRQLLCPSFRPGMHEFVTRPPRLFSARRGNFVRSGKVKSKESRHRRLAERREMHCGGRKPVVAADGPQPECRIIPICPNTAHAQGVSPEFDKGSTTHRENSDLVRQSPPLPRQSKLGRSSGHPLQTGSKSREYFPMV